MSAVDECGEYPTVQPTEEMDVRVISLDAERIRRRMGDKPPAFEWDDDGLKKLARYLVEQACAKGPK